MAVRVKDQYRKNPLSTQEGGQTVTIIHQTGQSFIYDKVKKPGLYIKHLDEKQDVSRGPIVEVLVDGVSVWKDSPDNTKKPWEI